MPDSRGFTCMLCILKLGIVFAVLNVLLRLKWKVGNVLIASSALLACLYAMPIPVMARTVRTTVIDPVTIKIFFALTLIRILEMILRERRVLGLMMETARMLLRKKKLVLISMPLLIGMLPSLGGAYFSAPMVEESSKGMEISGEEKAFINYWYRHPWEYVLPIYPGVLLAAALTGIDLQSFLASQGVLAGLMFVTGFAFSMRGIGKEVPKSAGGNHPLESTFCFLPLFWVMVAVIVLHIEPHYAMALTILVMMLFYRFSFKDVGRALKYGFTLDVITLIFGAMLFKFTLENSGAVVELSGYLNEKGISLLPVLVMLPMATGLLTGLTVGFVSTTFPLIISMAGGAHLNEIVLAFSAGYIGVLLSPVHLCLILTCEYFKADMWGIYKKIIPACAIIFAAALAEYFLLR